MKRRVEDYEIDEIRETQQQIWKMLFRTMVLVERIDEQQSKLIKMIEEKDP